MYGLARRIFGSSIWMLFAMALTCANPLVLDHLSVARGYGLGLSFWAAGAYCLARWVAGEERTRWLAASGAAMGLSVASYLTEAFAVGALAASFLLVWPADRLLNGGRRAAFDFLRRSAIPFAAAGLGAGLPILWGPMSMKEKAQIDGDATFREGIRSLLDAFLSYRINVFASHGPVWTALHRWPLGILFAFWLALALALAVVVWRWRKARRLGEVNALDRQMLLFGAAVLVMFLVLRFEPALLHHPYFGQRRLLCAVPLLLLTAVLWCYWLKHLGRPGRLAAWGGSVVLMLLSVHLATQFTPQTLYQWEFDAGTRELVRVLRDRRPAQGATPVSVGGSPVLVHTINFYRGLYGMTWVEPVSILGPGCYHDYYIVTEPELPSLERFAPRVIHRNQIAESLIAELGPQVRERMAALREAGFAATPHCEADLLRPEPWAAAGKPGVNGHFLRDVMEASESDLQRWTFEHPTYLFGTPRETRTRFRLHMRLPLATWRKTGPLRLTLKINGRRAGERALSHAEDHDLEWPVPPECLRSDGLALVETELDKYFIAEADGQKLGYLFVAGGFEPAH
jgi:hypothetical protein